MTAFLNIIIGLVFTYLILSLVASEIQEQLAAVMEYRAAHLKKAIKVLLGEDKFKLQENAKASIWKIRSENQSENQEVLIPQERETEFKNNLDPKQVWLDESDRVVAMTDSEVAISQDASKGKLKKDQSEVRKAELELEKVSAKSLTNLLYENSAIRDLNQYAIGLFVRNLFRMRFRFPPEDRVDKYSEGPSYIPSETFALSLLEVIQDQLSQKHKLDLKSDTSNSIIEKINTLPFIEETKKRLTQLVKRIDLKTARVKLVENNNLSGIIPLKLLQDEITTWYRQSIAPSSGVYKRNAKGLSMLIGLLMAVLLNINVFNIINSLQNQALRDSLVKNAAGLVQDQKFIESCVKAQGSTEDPDKIKQECSSRVQSVANTLNEQNPTLDIGWKTDSTNINVIDQVQKEIRNNTGKALLGWLLSGIAIAMGAPFWFDVLNRFMNVRNAAKPIVPPSQNDSSRSK
jgi:hypothetical protein